MWLLNKIKQKVHNIAFVVFGLYIDYQVLNILKEEISSFHCHRTLFLLSRGGIEGVCNVCARQILPKLCYAYSIVLDCFSKCF